MVSSPLYNNGMQKIKDMSGKSRALYIVISALCLALACWACANTLRTWVQVASVIIMIASVLMIILLLILRAGAEKSQDSPYAPQLQQLVLLDRDGQEKLCRIRRLVDTLFGAGSLTAARFSGAAQSALSVLAGNVDQGQRAVAAFGSDSPTKERELVFSGYIRESRSVLDQLDRLLLLLVQYDQSQDHDAESVTAQLEEITSTIHLYEHN